MKHADASTLPPLVKSPNFEVDVRAESCEKTGAGSSCRSSRLLLTVLLESAGEVVTREELRKRLWSTDTFVDFDYRLTVAGVRKSRIRSALGVSEPYALYLQNGKYVPTVSQKRRDVGHPHLKAR